MWWWWWCGDGSGGGGSGGGGRCGGWAEGCCDGSDCGGVLVVAVVGIAFERVAVVMFVGAL